MSSICKAVAIVAVGAVLALSRAEAQTKTFTGVGNWTDGARWSPSPPVDGDDVIVDGVCTNTASTENLGSYTLNATRTHVFGGTNSFLRATHVIISGIMTHLANTATTTNSEGQWIPDNLLNIVAVSNVTVGAGGQINADGKGYKSARGKGGYGPGGGKYTGVGGGGAGHGGRGAESRPDQITADGGLDYGISNAPVEPGSGGANSAYNFGGGAVRIQAGNRVTVNGSISANGSYYSEDSAAGASGGSIFITCGAIDGAGLISAKASDASGEALRAAAVAAVSPSSTPMRRCRRRWTRRFSSRQKAG